jgi:methionyl-tRNA formyltransferase
MRIVFFGTPQFAVPSLQRLIAHPDFAVVAVVTQPDKRRGRGNQVSASPVKALALETQCPIWQPERIKKDPEILANLQALQADAFVVVAYGQILPTSILAMPRLGCINGHGSILPAYRGAAPIQWSLVNGESETGITTMQMDAGMDTGPMLLKATLPIGLLDNAWTVADTLAHLTADLLIDTLHQLDAGTITPIPQDPTLATYAPLIQKENYTLDWQKSALALHNQVRGFYPGCVTQFRGDPLKILKTIPLGDAFWSQLPAEYAPLQAAYETQGLSNAPSPNLDISPGNDPGTVVACLKNYGAIVATGDGHLLLEQVQPAGKKAQSGWDFVNGTRLNIGETL